MTGPQRQDDLSDFNIDSRMWRDARCWFTVKPVRDSLSRIKRLLDPANLLSLDCAVQKHPEACPACVANDRCERLPVHHWCRCKRAVRLSSPLFSRRH